MNSRTGGAYSISNYSPLYTTSSASMQCGTVAAGLPDGPWTFAFTAN